MAPSRIYLAFNSIALLFHDRVPPVHVRMKSYNIPSLRRPLKSSIARRLAAWPCSPTAMERAVGGKPMPPPLPLSPYLCCRFTLGTLVQARERELMTQWAEMLRKHLPYRPDACRWLLSELGRSPTILKELLLSAEEAVRQAAASVADAALRQCMLAAGGGGGGECGGVSQDGVGDVYLEAYTAAVEEQDRLEAEEFNWGQDLGEGFVAMGQGSVDTGAQDDGTSVAQKTVRGIL